MERGQSVLHTSEKRYKETLMTGIEDWASLRLLYKTLFTFAQGKWALGIDYSPCPLIFLIPVVSMPHSLCPMPHPPFPIPYSPVPLMPLALGNIRFSFALLWTLATFGGFLWSLLLIEVGEKPDIGVVEAAIGGFAIALFQGCLLKQPILCIRWILSSLLGWSIITAIGIGGVGWIVPSTQILPLRILSGAVYGALGGFGIGLAQWLAIPHHKAWRWIFVSSASWAVAIPVGSAVGIILRRLTQLFLGEVMGLAITWLLVGILTGMNAHKLLCLRRATPT